MVKIYKDKGNFTIEDEQKTKNIPDRYRRNTGGSPYQEIKGRISLRAILEKNGGVISMESEFDWKRERENIRTLQSSILTEKFIRKNLLLK